MVQMGHLPLILNIHDELIFEVDKRELEATKDEVCGIMIKTAEDLLDFPVEVDWEVADRWGEMSG